MKSSVLFRSAAMAVVAAALLVAGQSREALAAETKPLKKIDINKATAAQLEDLPGIGPALSKKIIAARPYKSVKDLSKAGISANEINKIDSLVTVGPSVDPAPVNDKPLTKTGKPALVDLNKATAKQLEELPGVQSAYAKKIMAARPFKSVDDLAKAGIPSATVARIKSLVTIDGANPTHTVAKPIATDEKSRRVDLNTAKESALQEVSGIGEAYAKKIIEGRPYKSVDELAKAGIPASTIEKVRAQVTAGRAFEAPPQKGMVWVNLDSKRYHKEGSTWYGKTKNGKYMTEADAIKDGNQLAHTRAKKN